MVKKCRCHGVSGSCSLQTCWMEMAPFREIAKKLRQKYVSSVQISFEATKGALSVGNSGRHLLKSGVLSNNLVYLEKSPDFCVPDNKTGTCLLTIMRYSVSIIFFPKIGQGLEEEYVPEAI